MASRGACTAAGSITWSASTLSMSAASSTERANGPTWSSDHASGTAPSTGTSPCGPLSPTTPQNAAGRRIEPTVCEPMAPGTMRAATAAAEPDDEPPGVWAGFHGLRAGDGSRNANCVVWVLPRMTAPAARSRATAPQSRVGRVWANSRAPAVVGIPATSKMSLMPTGTPCSGPRERPAVVSASRSRAAARAPSASRWAHASTWGSSARTRARQASTRATDEQTPRRM